MSDAVSHPIPVALFAYARPDTLRRTLEGLRANAVPRLLAFSDGPRGEADRPAVEAVRRMLRAIDWCPIEIVERQENLGLGRSILAGVRTVLDRSGAVIVVEDDLVCAPGAYRYLSAALRQYAGDSRVMSVTGWTHARVLPPDAGDRPYFDGRGDCWVWGTWRRAWEGMERSALDLMNECRRSGKDIFRYGADLPEMARAEGARNIWAVRFHYLHQLRGGLCLRPPASLVLHIGAGTAATNVKEDQDWPQATLAADLALPPRWPEPVENRACPALWQGVYGGRPTFVKRCAAAVRAARAAGLRLAWKLRLKRALKSVLPPLAWSLARRARQRLSPSAVPPEAEVCRWSGAYATWEDAVKDSTGYDAAVILERTKAALLKVRSGEAVFERDSVLYDHVQYSWPLVGALMLAAARAGGRLSVADFGGSLGSVYFQVRAFLRRLPDVRWGIVEQRRVVECGRECFEDETLRFYETLKDCVQSLRPNAVVLSGVLQYLQEPYAMLDEIGSHGFDWLIIDRTPMHKGAGDRLTVQQVPPDIYPASYPCWLLDESRMLARLAPRYELVEAFDAIDGGFADFRFRGYILCRRPAAGGVA